MWFLQVGRSEFQRRPIKDFASSGSECQTIVCSWNGVGGFVGRVRGLASVVWIHLPTRGGWGPKIN